MTGVMEVITDNSQVMNEDAKVEQVASLWGGASREDLQSKRHCSDNHNPYGRT